MDWLHLVLVLLAVAGHINAQEGYNYPKPKTPFSGDIARDSRLPSTTAGQSTSQGTQPQGFDGPQRPFGSQQPSAGYNNGIQSQTPQQSVGGYPGSEQPETPAVDKRPFGSQDVSSGYPNGQLGAKNNQQTLFGTQQQSSGYPSVGQTGTPSFRTQPRTETPFLTQQPSTSYSGSSSGIQGPFGAGPSTGTQGSSGNAPSTGTQGPFGTRPTGSTQGAFVGTEGFLRTQQPKYQGARPTTQDYSGGFPGERRPNEPSSSGSEGQQSPSPSTTGKTQYTGQDLNRPSTGRQEGYNYPTPERSFEGNAPTTRISGDSRSSAPLFRQSPSQSPAREGAFEESGLKGTPQFPTGRDSLNDYPSPSSGPQGSISSSRPSSGAQQNGYPESGRPQSSFSSPTTERQQTFKAYSASERPQDSFPSSRPSPTNQQTPNGYAQARNLQSSFPSTSKYPGVESQYSSGNGQGSYKQDREESANEGIPSAQSPVRQGKYRQPESTGILGRQNGTPRIDSTERPTGQFPINNSPVEGQKTKGYPTQERFPSSLQSKVRPSNYPQIEQRPLSSYLPPGVKGTGELPLSQFPSTGFSQVPSRSGVSETPRPSENGYSGSLKPGGGLPSSRTSSGAQLPSEPLGRPQNGFGSGTPTSIGGSSSRLPSGLSGQSPRSQNGYDVSRTPTGRGSFESGTPTSTDGSSSRLPSGFPDQSPRSQNGYDVSRTTNGRGSFESGTPTSTDGSSDRLPSGLSDQSSRSENGYDVAGRRPFESDKYTGPAVGQEQVLAKSAQPFVRPGGGPGYGSDEGIQQGFLRPVNGQVFPGFQKGPQDGQYNTLDNEGDFDEQEEGDYSAIPGQPGRDYPILSDVPETSFNCDDQEYIGYYADVETRCQIFHICANNKTYDFICPNGTIFHQQNLVCVWWNQFDCDTALTLYRVNKDIYDLSMVGAQQTGGIPVSGQGYPDLSEGGFGFGRQPGVAPDSSVRRPGGYRSEEGLPESGGNQISGEYPRGRTQESTGPSSTRYSGEGSQGPGGYSSEDSQRPSIGVGGYSNGRPQGSISPSSTGYSNGKPSGSGGYRGPIGESPKPGNDGQRPQEYPSRTEGENKYQTSNGDVQRPQGSYSNGPSTQVSGSYPSARKGPVTYPHGQPQGVEEQRPLQKSGNGKYPSHFSGVERLQKPQDTTGYPNERPQGADGSQYPSEEQQKTGTGAQRFGGGPEGIVGLKPQSYSPAQNPGQYKNEGPQGSGFSLGQGRQTPVEYGPPERSQGPGVSNLPESGKYPSGTPSKPGFRTSAPISSGSPFPGSSPPHQPTREYLPAV